ncbi:hypothetical protein SAMD00023353_1900330 [Rosellinia necatrix]|uniref:Uncharacterized protein n=1 Tax=Rosellinia necatrix TaxID=77044 RepID=A0A1W2TEU0_ROSNE|nr:hypothetical protein SAMD00023353_1900330 [Rosellinia necatrix]
MTSVAEPAPHVDAPLPWDHARQSPPSPESDANEEPRAPPRDIDSISFNSIESLPDAAGRRLVTFDGPCTTAAYEAWELVSIENRHIRKSWWSFCGIKFGTKWLNRNDGCVLVNPTVSFGQGELADMHEDAIRGYKQKHGTSQERAYEQDLANRAYDLPVDIYDKVQNLIEDRTNATNMNPYRQREWRVVVLQAGEFRMTELLPERKRRNIFSRKREPASRTWFVVLRGQEVKSTKENGGWKAFNRISNPWWRLDSQETKEERETHKDRMKKIDRAHRPSRHHHRPRPRPRPAGPTPHIRPPAHDLPSPSPKPEP